DGNGNTHIDFPTDSYNGYSLEWVALPDNVTAIKLVYTSNHMKVEALLSAYVTLHPSDHVLSLMENRTSISLTNINTLLLYDSNGNLAGVEGTYEGEATDSVKDHDETVYSTDLYHKKASISLTSIEIESQIAKGIVSQTNDTALKRTVIQYAINAGEYVGYDRTLYTDDEIRELNLIDPQQEAVFYDLLPAGMETDVSTVHAYFVTPAIENGATSYPYIGISDTSSAGEPVVGQEFEVSATLIRNWRGSGRTMLIAHVTAPEGFENFTNFKSWSTAKNFLGSYIRLEFTGYYPWSEYADRGGSLHNIAAYQTLNDEITDGYGNDTTDFLGNWTYGRTDFQYLNGVQEDSEEQVSTDENTAAQFLYIENTSTINPLVSADMSLTKRVKGPRGITWSTGHDGETEVEVTTGEYYTYKIHMGSDTGTETGNIVLFDILEQYTPSGVSEQWRGTLVSIDTTYITARGINPVIYYSTVSGITDPDYSDLEDTSVWSTEAPDDLSTVTAIAVDCRKTTSGSDYWLPENQSLSLYITMQAPTDESVVEDLSARNIKAYNSTYALSNVRSTAEGTSESKSKASGYTEVGLYYKQIEVTKTWLDNEDMYGTRPDNIIVTLLADGTAVDSAVLGRNDDGTETWSVVFDGLSKYSASGDLIEYTVEEQVVGSDGTTTTLTPVSESSDDSWISYEIPEGLSTSEFEQVLSAWDLSSSQSTVQTALTLTEEFTADDSGTETENATVQIGDAGDGESDYQVHLLANGEKTGTTGLLTSTNGWTYTFEDLPTEDSSGSEIEYSAVIEQTTVSVAGTWADEALMSEVTVRLLANGEDTGKTLTLSESSGWSGEFTGLVSSDYSTGESITYTVVEDWAALYDDDSSGGIENTEYSLINGDTTTSIDVEKIWDDSIADEDIRDIEVNLLGSGTVVDTVTLSEENSWEYTFESLPVADDDGNLIVYTVEEVMPDGEDYSVFTDSWGSRFYITNKEKLTSLSGTKTWDDSENQDGMRPSSITVRLLADGQPALDEDGNAITKTVTASDGWEYTFSDIPEWNDDGTKISYTVTEDSVPDYTVSYSGNDITNSYTPGKTSITVVKSWDDNSNADGVRPDSVTVHLFADGEDTGKTVTLNEDNQWRAVFSGLDQKKDGQDIRYTVVEDVPNGYSSEVTGSETEGYIIINSHPPKPGDNIVHTSDESRPGLWSALMIVSLCTIVFCVIKKRRAFGGRA
ncbi:MAG: Cna B-type domain-containing protein, partial [Oscillospiraceae bacterium]